MFYLDKDNSVKNLRQIARMYDAHELVKDKKLSPKELKRRLMEIGYPESSARSMVNEIKAAQQGVLYYDEEEDKINQDQFYIDEFYAQLAKIINPPSGKGEYDY
jgi:hypothetical protein